MKLIVPPSSPYLPHRNLHRLPNRQLCAFWARNDKIEGYILWKRALATQPEPDQFFVATEIDHGRVVAAPPGMNACLPEYSHREVNNLLHVDRRIISRPEETFLFGIDNVPTGCL